MRMIVTGLAALALGAAGPAAAATNIWSTTFESGLFEQNGPFPHTVLGLAFGGATVQGAQSLPGFGGNFLRNDTGSTTFFSAGGLGAHTALELSFDLAFIDSWDSTNGSPAPDLLLVDTGGGGAFQFTTNNASGTVVDFGPGVVVGGPAQYGFNGSFNDVVVHYSFVFAHTASDWEMSIKFGGAGFQGGTDESWGIDNFSLAAVEPSTTPGIPEPATWALMIGGFGLAGSALRRRRLHTA